MRAAVLLLCLALVRDHSASIFRHQYRPQLDDFFVEHLNHINQNQQDIQQTGTHNQKSSSSSSTQSSESKENPNISDSNPKKEQANNQYYSNERRRGSMSRNGITWHDVQSTSPNPPHPVKAHSQGFLRGIVDQTIRNRVIQTMTDKEGDTIGSAINVLSNIPIEIARHMGTYTIPTIENNNNAVDTVDNILAEYHVGLSNEDAKLSFSELMFKYGHPLENHKVTTEDGYILRLYRIPGKGPTVFLMHGLLGSADDYILAGPDSALAYQLAKDGYDVWLGNARGNKYSRHHIRLKPSDGEFWNFSWHEIGIYDLPAMIDYVLEKTNSTTLKYIGYSQGTTSFWVMASEKPEYNDKISVMIALSPVAFMGHAKSPIIRLASPSSPVTYSALTAMGVDEFLPDNVLVKTVERTACGSGPVAEILCENVIFLIVGFDLGQVNVTNLPVVFGHEPAGASVKQLAHYGQGVTSGEFRKFDYGFAKNMHVYGTKTPPKYQLNRVSAPVALFHSDGDWLAHPKDVDKLSRQIKNVVENYNIPNEHFNHLDFITAKDYNNLIYNKVLEILKKF